MKYLITFVIISIICSLIVVNILDFKMAKNKKEIKNPVKFEYLTERRDPDLVVCINNFAYYCDYHVLAPLFNTARLPMTCEEFKQLYVEEE